MVVVGNSGYHHVAPHICAGFVSASESGDAQDFHTLYVLPQAVRGLVALVFLFDLYTIYQHLQIHRIRRQLIEREELFHLISQNAADMIAVVDLEGRRIFNSLSYQKILGYSPEELQESFANRDITERKKVQEALVRSEASFRSLVEGRRHYLHACRKHATAISTHKPAKR